MRMRKNSLRKALLIYGSSLCIILIIFLLTENKVLALTLLVGSLFAPIRVLFPGYSRKPKEKDTTKLEA
jgi:hypothetical protein